VDREQGEERRGRESGDVWLARKESWGVGLTLTHRGVDLVKDYILEI